MAQEPIGGQNHKWWVLAAVGIGILMATIDVSIVNIALPTILTYFQTDLTAVEWVVVAYLLAITILLLPFGRLADMLGRKRVYAAGFVVFTLGSALCGLSQGVLELTAFRVLQAVGAAMLTANGFAIVTAVFPARERGMALGINGTVVATGITLGPTIGGLLISSLGWRWIFLVNLPIGIVGTAAAVVILDERVISGGHPHRAQQFDLAGAATSALSLIALLLALNLGPEVGWTSGTVILLVALFVLFGAAFAAIESRVEHPMVDLTLFHDRTFTAGNLAGVFSFLAISANAFLMPFFLQLVLGYSPLQAGLMMTPTALVMAVVAPISGWVSDRLGARVLSSVGLALNCIGLLLLSILTADSNFTDVLKGLLLLGFGQGLFQSPNNASVMGVVPRSRYGIASGLLSMMRNVGSVVGVAVSASFLLGSLFTVVGHASLGVLQYTGLPGGNQEAVLSAFLAGMREAYRASAVFAALGVAASLVRGSGAGGGAVRREKHSEAA